MHSANQSQIEDKQGLRIEKKHSKYEPYKLQKLSSHSSFLFCITEYLQLDNISDIRNEVQVATDKCSE